MAMKIFHESFLKKVGVSDALISDMKKAGLGFKVTYKTYYISYDGGGVGGPLFCDSKSIMEGKGSVKAATLSILSEELTNKATEVLTKAAYFEKEFKEVVLPSSPPSLVAPVSDIIRLHEAKALYQRVKGTSDNSVYVVVGVHPDFVVAARVHDKTISVRIEPTNKVQGFTIKVLQAFSNEGLTDKAGYMSGHYTVADKKVLARVVGSILIGSGFSYSTPVPDFNKVLELSK